MIEKLVKIWLSEVEFPTTVGKYRIEATTPAEFFKYIFFLSSRNEDIFIPFYSKREQSEQATKIFIDIDADNQAETWKNLKIFLTIFYENVKVFFSGKKGFHIVLYIEPTSWNILEEKRLKLYENLSAWCQVYLDKIVFLSKNRLYRLAFTQHPESKRWKIPISIDYSISDIFRISSNPYQYIGELERLYYKPIKPLPFDIILENPSSFV